MSVLKLTVAILRIYKNTCTINTTSNHLAFPMKIFTRFVEIKFLNLIIDNIILNSNVNELLHE